MKKGFSLIEIALVILIISLLLAAVSAGSKIIKQAELRNIISEMENLKTAYHTYNLYYDEIPGDDPNAFSYYGTYCGTTATECNGDGNGIITGPVGALPPPNEADEISKAFLHLSLGGLIAGEVTPIVASHNGNTTNYTLDSGLPKSRYTFGSGGANFTVNGTGPLNTAIGDTDQNILILGNPQTASINYTLGALTAFETFSIDKKIDDGKTISGEARGRNTGSFGGSNEAGQTLGCSIVDASDPAYNISNNAKTCVPNLLLD